MLLIVNSISHVTRATVLTPAALHSRPIRPLSFGHVQASLFHTIELCCI